MAKAKALRTDSKESPTLLARRRAFAVSVLIVSGSPKEGHATAPSSTEGPRQVVMGVEL